MQKYFHITLRLWRLLKPFHKELYSQLLLMTLIECMGIYYAVFTGKIIDSLITKDISVIVKMFIYFIIFVFIFWTLDFIKDYRYSINFIDPIYQHLKEYSLRGILKLNNSQMLEQHSAIKYEIVSTGEEKSVLHIERLLLYIFPSVVMFLFSMALLASYSFVLCIITGLMCCFVIYSEKRFLTSIKEDQKELVDRRLTQNKVTRDAFTHLATVKIFSVTEKFVKKFLEKRLSYMNFNMGVNRRREIYQGKRNYLNASLGLFSMFYSVVLYIGGKILAGGVYTIFQINNQIFGKMKNIQQSFDMLSRNFTDIEKYLDVIDMQPSFIEEGPRPFTAGDIRFENINFKYPKGEQNVLSDLSFEIKKGQKVAFVGYSGSGKTTIVQLLLRAYDYERDESKGSDIKINGVSLKDMSASSLREHVGYVEQHVDLFDDTIKNNIIFGIKDQNLLNKIELEEKENKDGLGVIESIAKKARIDQFYHRLGEAKFETMIGERGVKLSGGERQRVGIARAMIKDPEIMIFDEATSALDAENEKYIKEAIDEASRGRTTIIIAHRLSTVRDADNIFMMSHGKILAEGTHDELLASSREYKSLVESQMN